MKKGEGNKFEYNRRSGNFLFSLHTAAKYYYRNQHIYKGFGKSGCYKLHLRRTELNSPKCFFGPNRINQIRNNFGNTT